MISMFWSALSVLEKVDASQLLQLVEAYLS